MTYSWDPLRLVLRSSSGAMSEVVGAASGLGGLDVSGAGALNEGLLPVDDCVVTVLRPGTENTS